MEPTPRAPVPENGTPCNSIPESSIVVGLDGALVDINSMAECDSEGDAALFFLLPRGNDEQRIAADEFTANFLMRAARLRGECRELEQGFPTEQCLECGAAKRDCGSKWSERYELVSSPGYGSPACLAARFGKGGAR